MDSPSHAAVSSSHTAEVQSSPVEVRHLPSWEFQNSKDLSACFYCYASPRSLRHLSSPVLLYVRHASLPAERFERLLHLNFVSIAAALQRKPCRGSPSPPGSLGSPSRLSKTCISATCLQRTRDIGKDLSHLLHKLFDFLISGGKEKREQPETTRFSEHFLLVRNRSAEKSPSLPNPEFHFNLVINWEK